VERAWVRGWSKFSIKFSIESNISILELGGLYKDVTIVGFDLILLTSIQTASRCSGTKSNVLLH
jgi:hypothetical protein